MFSCQRRIIEFFANVAYYKICVYVTMTTPTTMDDETNQSSIVSIRWLHGKKSFLK